LLRTVLRALIFPALLVVLTVTAVACGGGNDSKTQEDDSARPISGDELARMLLSQGQYGLEFQGFTADKENGPFTLEEAASNDFDPDRERTRLEGAGFSMGHKAFFSNSQAVTARNGLFQIGGSVGLFTDGPDTSTYFKDVVAGIGEDVSKTNGGVTLTKIERFDAQVADEAAGGRVEAHYEEMLTEQEKKKRQPVVFDFWGAEVLFRHGRLVGTVSVSGIALSDAEKERLEGRLKDLARKLDEQMTAVLAGTPAPSVASGGY
jgi:hypothetical protein